MTAVLISGGAGFFGGLLKARLLNEGAEVVSVDLEPDYALHPRLTSVQGDICDRSLIAGLFERYRFASVFHCAALLAHNAKSGKRLWRANVEGTRIVADNARRCGVRSLVFLSSNCLWGRGFGRPVQEQDPPQPVEIYGRSKHEAETILAGYSADMNVAIIRCPTIIDEGRLGLLTLLFDFIREARKVWVIGDGANRYQFIYAQDLVEACLRASRSDVSGTFNIGSDDVKALREVFQYVIDKAGTGARIASLPRAPALAAMRICYHLGLSPLGPYQYKMIAEDFVFATDRIKFALGWQPTLTNEQMLYRAYQYYAGNIHDIRQRKRVSAHRRAADPGVIRLLKWVS